MCSRIGVILMILGVAMGDSDNLIFPAIALAAGAALYFIGKAVSHEGHI